jgi:hypothetical protein
MLHPVYAQVKDKTSEKNHNHVNALIFIYIYVLQTSNLTFSASNYS